MATTPQDWRVTAAQQARRAIAEFKCALDGSADPDAPVLSLADVLVHVWRASRAADAAVGALVTAELRAGMSWAEVAGALGLPDAEQARRTLAPAMAAGERSLHERLPHA